MLGVKKNTTMQNYIKQKVKSLCLTPTASSELLVRLFPPVSQTEAIGAPISPLS